MVGNIDESSRIVWRLDDSSWRQSIYKTLRKKYSKENKEIVRNIDDSNRVESSVWCLDDSS